MKKQLIPFLMAGDPDLETTEILAQSLIDAGVRTIELGVPFSDPLADGPVIQRAAARALAKHTNLTKIFALVERLTKRNRDVVVVLFSYLNPILNYGLEAYTLSAGRAGVKATLVVDMPLEEAGEHLRHHRASRIGTVFLASPTTSIERLKEIEIASKPFVYYVSRTGVTGEQPVISESLTEELKTVRKIITGPLAVGFGISTPEQAKKISYFADSVVIGSKFISMIEESQSVDQAKKAVHSFATACLEALL